MRNTIALAGLALSITLAPQMADAGQRNAHHETTILAGKIDHLRAVVRPRSQLAEEAVCRMEEIADRLCEKLTCPHELEPILCAMRDLTSAADSAAITIQRECRLRNDFVIRDSLERVLRQLARVQVAVEQLVRRAALSPGYAPPHAVPHSPDYGQTRNAPIPGIPGPNFGSAIPDLPPWMRAELERRSARSAPSVYSQGYDPYASSQRYEAYSRNSGHPGRSLNQFAPHAGSLPPVGNVPPGSLRLGLNTAPVPDPGFPNSGRPTGRIGQTILSLLLSEALR